MTEYGDRAAPMLSRNERPAGWSSWPQWSSEPDEKRPIAIQSLSIPQLTQILELDGHREQTREPGRPRHR